MKYALFEFVNEIGETQWIARKDPESVVNTGWDISKSWHDIVQLWWHGR